jgi:endonuclease/exonuclease/phosphatase family metal-dependent hydrolase
MSFYHYVLAVFITCIAFAGCTSTSDERSDTVRVMTYNIEDVRTADLQNPDNPRLQNAAAVIQHLRPDILLINEMTYDLPGAPNVPSDAPAGQNGQRFVDNFLSVAQADSLEPIRYQSFMAPVNTGLASGFDLNNDGDTVTTYPQPAPPQPSGAPAPQTPEGRAYGNDAWGFGVFPGQYGMALFVRDGFEIVRDSVRTFRLFRWSDMPGALRPMNPATGDPWYADAEWERMRLSSKSHWDVPIRLPDGRTLHVLASHPTPPGFDGEDDRNGHRNHDEIRLWADYLSNRSYIEDDSSRTGGLAQDALFVVMGDQNADPDEGDTYQQPIQLLLEHERVQSRVVPTATPAGRAAYPDLDPDDTAEWGLRVDYVLPSVGLPVDSSGVWRPVGADTTGVPVSDHFPVWIDLAPPP